MLEVQNITKSYGELSILKDISFSIKEGEIVSIVGSSGAGKT
ncbi:MAG: ATP-binding cassette domain-containing protein, partial [Bacteroidota bacterium]